MSSTSPPEALSDAVSTPPRYLSMRDLAEYLNLPVQTLWKWRKAGKLPQAVRFGRLIRYRLEDIQAWEASRPAA